MLKVKNVFKYFDEFSSCITSLFIHKKKIASEKEVQEEVRCLGRMGQQCICCLTFLCIHYFAISCLPFSTTSSPRFSSSLLSASLLFAHRLHTCKDFAS